MSLDLIKEIKGKKTIAITGHLRPDGDCIGSTMALYQYIKSFKEELNIDKIDLYLEPISDCFKFLKGSNEIIEINDSYDYENTDLSYDLFITLDSGSIDRINRLIHMFRLAKKTMNIDHHISNTNFAEVNHVVHDASSTAEVIYGLIEKDRITKDIAEALYIGIIHDTGVFKHSNTSKKTMMIAGELIEKGIDFSKLIDETFYQRTYVQNQLLGRVLMNSQILFAGKCIIGWLDKNILDLYHVESSELDGMIDQLRQTKGIEIAVFLYEQDINIYKVSMRSNSNLDVNDIALFFDGGGHKKAAGCTINGTTYDVIDRLLKQIEPKFNI